MMVTYHAAYDVWFLAPGADIDPFGGGWRALQVATGSSFLFVVGLSLAVSNARARGRGVAGAALWRRHARRAAQVGAAALVVSVATLVALGPEDYVRWGVLHCIAAAMVLLPLLAPLPPPGLVALAAAVVIAGVALRDAPADALGALVLAGSPTGGAGVDHYPLLPWLGPAILGLAAGAVLYPGGDRRPGWDRWVPAVPAWAHGPLTAPGRHALPIYLVHQPVLIALLALVLGAAGVAVDPGTR
jgi:uncharacterized membrane protein